MKMFKKLLTGALAAACVLGMAMNAAAAEVPSVVKDNKAVTGVNAENGDAFAWRHEISYVQYLPKDVANAIVTANASETDKYVNTVSDFVKAANNPTITQAFSDGKDWVWRSTFGDLIPVSVPSYGSGPVKVTFTVPGIGSESEQVQVVHYSASKGWQVLKATITGNDTIAVEFEDFSPTAIAIVQKKAVPTATPAKTAATTTATSTATNSNASPKTGVETDWMGYAAAAVILAVCGAMVSRKRRA